MPVPEERLYNSDRLNRWFAVAGVLMMGSFVWMSYVDYARPWRDYQSHYYLSKAAMAHLGYLEAITEDKQKEIEAAKKERDRVKADYGSSIAAQASQLEKELADADLAFRKVNGPWSRANQVLQVTRDTYEKALGARGADDPETKRTHQAVLDGEEKVDALAKDKEHWEDLRNETDRKLRELRRPIQEATKRVADLEKVAQDALEKDMAYRGVLWESGPLSNVPVISTLINLPFLDFTAPKNTPGREQVNQLVLPDVRQRLNYLETYTTDRCTTCHVAIDDEEFSVEQLARKLERALPAINEELQRKGLKAVNIPAPLQALDGSTLPAGRVTEFWSDLTREEQKGYFDALLSSVNAYLAQTGRKQIELGQPLLAHPDLDLYVTVDSPHPMQHMGCTVCHEGNPQETDFVLAAHTPPTHEIEEHWKDEYYDTQLGIPTMTFETVEHYWDRPMRLPKYTEGGCAKCHGEIADISEYEGKRHGERINLGQYLFINVGCVNCHVDKEIPNPRRVGPDLTSVAEKLTPAFVQQWAFFPQKFRPSTRMPHFFMQENNGPGSENTFDPDPVKRTETEVAAISQYLFTVSRPWQAIEKPDGIEGDAARGRALFKKVGCLGCHGNLAEFGEEWITDDLMYHEDLDRETANFRYKGMTYEERIRYAMDHFVNERDTFLRPEEARFDPDHEYNTPAFSRFAPELSAVGSKVNFKWLYSWLMQPTHYAPDTKMPNLRLSPAQAADIATYLMTLRYDGFDQGEFEMDSARREMADDLIFTLLSSQRSERRSRAIMADAGGELTQMLVTVLAPSIGRDEASKLVGGLSLDDRKLTFLGNKAISYYGCYACHKIPGFEETSPPGTELSAWAERPVTQLDFAFYSDAFDGMREQKRDIFGTVYPKGSSLNHWSPTPDDMPEQITLTHAAFAKHKMLNPRIWDREKIKRPYDKLKMPNFYFTEKEAEALTTYLLSRRPARVTDALSVDYDKTPAGPIGKGRKLTRELNCVGCHQIENNYPLVQQYFRRELAGELFFDVVNAPPILRGEGAKLQHNWFHQFLQQVEPLRPWLTVRMPSFNITSDEATTLVEYFAALSQRDAAKLGTELAHVDEYIDGAQARAGKSAGADWYDQASLEKPAKALERFAVARDLIRAREIDPLTNDKDRLTEAHAMLLDRVKFIQALYDVDYPFVEPPSPLSSQERFDKGLKFIQDMGCLKCHVMGDMLPGPAKTTDDFVQMYRLDGVRGEGDDTSVILNGVPHAVGAKVDGFTIISGTNTVYDTGDIETQAVVEGPNPAGQTERVMLQAASAPNLSLTYRRLRRTWVFNWMLNPGLIQPGTKMPQNFAGGKSPFEGDPQYPGTGTDHINLLVDTLFDAGAKSVRVPLQKITVSAEDEEFDEEGGEAFDEDDFDD